MTMQPEADAPEIDSAPPVPMRKTLYPWGILKVGQSFWVAKTIREMGGQVSWAQDRHGIKLRSKREDHGKARGTRFWRTE